MRLSDKFVRETLSSRARYYSFQLQLCLEVRRGSGDYMSDENPTFFDEPQAGSSFAEIVSEKDPLPIPAPQRAWRQALLEELRAAWQSAEEMREILPAAPKVAAAEACAADTRKQLETLKVIFARLNEQPPLQRRSCSLFWKLEALSADPAGPARDFAILQALHSHVLLTSRHWQAASECCIRCGIIPDVPELLQAGFTERRATD
jgi:hypothetical protein